MNAVQAALTAMAATLVVGMGVGMAPVATGIATVKGVGVTGAGLNGGGLKGAMEIIEAVTGATAITDIAAALRAVLPIVLPHDLRRVFRTVADPMNARPEGGVLPPVVVGVVQVLSVPELLVLDPVGAGLVARIAAGMESDAPMEAIVDRNQVASRPAVVMETAAPVRVVSATARIVSRTESVGRSVFPTGVNPVMSVHRLGPVTERRQDVRGASIVLLQRCNPRPRLRRRQQMI